MRTPLVAIRGFTSLILEKPEELNPFQKTGMETVDRSSLLLSGLVDKLVWFSTLESDTMELTRRPQSVGEIVDGALADLGPYLRTQSVEMKRDPVLETLPLATMDKFWMQQALRNLIENAVKFNTKPKRQVRLGGQVVGRTICKLTVSDDGIGIPPEETTKIFQKFYQIDASFTGQVPGMGLGLALVQRVVDSHAATVRVESTLGSGSRFSISLPLK